MDFTVGLPSPDHRSSSGGYTVVGPSIWNTGWRYRDFVFTIEDNSIRYIIPENYSDIVLGAIQHIPYLPGDIVAVALDKEEPFKCRAGQVIRMVMGATETIEATVR